MSEIKQVKISGGWQVDIEIEQGGYKIIQILALFGHGVYFPVDTEYFTEEQWQTIHERLTVVAV